MRIFAFRRAIYEFARSVVEFPHFLPPVTAQLKKARAIVAILLGFAAIQMSASCQATATTLTSFPFPTASGVLGKEDATAVAELSAHLRAVAGAGWHDLEGTGTLTYEDGVARSASLYLLGSRFSRLDIVMDSGTRSVRLRSSSGVFQNESGEQHFLLPNTAREGIVAFPRVWTALAAAVNVSLVDHGLYVASGLSLHRVTIEYQLNSGGYIPGDSTIATDLYFDPNTHLLLFSVDGAQFANSAGQEFLVVTRYADYQQFGAVQVPVQIQQTINGQLQWTLRLSQVTLNSNPADSTFSF